MKRTTILFILFISYFSSQAQSLKAFIFSGEPSDIEVIDIITRKSIGFIKRPTPDFIISDAVLTEDQKTIFISGTYDYNNNYFIGKINTETGELFHIPIYSRNYIRDLILSPDEKHLYYPEVGKVFKVDTGTLDVIDSFDIINNLGSFTASKIHFINDSIIIFDVPPIREIHTYNLNTESKLEKISIGGKLQYSGCIFTNNQLFYQKGDTIQIIKLSPLIKDTFIISPILFNFNIRYPTLEDGKIIIPFCSGDSILVFNLNNYSFSLFTDPGNTRNAFKSPSEEYWYNYLDDIYKISIYDSQTGVYIDEITTGIYPYIILFAYGPDSLKSSIGAVNGIINLKLYPNPANDKITLETGYNEVKNYTIINSLGKTIMSFESTGTETEVDVSTLPPGVYFVIPNGDKTKAIKFIKQ